MLCSVFLHVSFAAAASAALLQDSKIDWVHGKLDEALQRATAQQKGVVVYFWKEGCDDCVRYFGETLSTGPAVAALEPYVCVSSDVGTSAGQALQARYAVADVPATLFLDAQGAPEDVVLGLRTPAALEASVARIRSGEGTVSGLRRAAEAQPDDLDARFALGEKLRALGSVAEATELFESIKADDPRGKSTVCARILLLEARDAVQAASADAQAWDLAPLEAHVKKIRPPEVAFAGWDMLAQMHLQRGEREDAFDAWRAAKSSVPDERAVAWGFAVGEAAWPAREDLSAKDKRLALDAADVAVKHLEARAKALAKGEAPTAQDRDGPTLGAALFLQARALVMNGKEKQAVALLDRAIELEPTVTDYRNLRAEID